MTASVPATWGASYTPSVLTISPGQQGQTSLSVSVPSGYPLGTNPFSATATNATNGAFVGSGSANLTVTEPVYTLTVSSDRGTVNMNPPNTNCHGNCTQSYAQSAATSVSLTSTPDKGYTFKRLVWRMHGYSIDLYRVDDCLSLGDSDLRTFKEAESHSSPFESVSAPGPTTPSIESSSAASKKPRTRATIHLHQARRHAAA
jgi:hypothetical protein